jgi:hypothetical protein
LPFVVLALCTSCLAQTPVPSAALTAEQIMDRVATNQDRTESARTQFVYVQHAKVQSRKGGTVMCEEITDTRIAPAPKGQTQTLLSLSGHVRDGKRIIHYTSIPKNSEKRQHNADFRDSNTNSVANKDQDGDDLNIGEKEIVLDSDAGNAPVPVSDTDIDLVENMRSHFTSDKGTKDGVREGLFPLTSRKQKDMLFQLKGREQKNGRDTYHITFAPRDNSDFDWKGDAWIDTAAFEPVVIRTALSRNIPFGVRAFLGTSVPGLGFTAIYAPQEGGVWFPASLGTEFRLKVLFAFHRQILVNIENRSFERTHVNATVHTEAAKPVDPAAEGPKPQP